MYKISIDDTLALKIKELRIKNHIKNKDLAAQMGKSAAYVTKLENGQIKQIKKDSFVKLVNYLAKSDDGYYSFCEQIAQELDADEIKNSLALMNFDFIDRKIPLNQELIADIKQKLNEFHITIEELAEYINKNDDLNADFYREHKINPDLQEKNIWLPYQEADSNQRNHFYVLINLKPSRIKNIIEGKITKCNYLTIFAIVYHLFKLSYGTNLDEDARNTCKIKTENYLLEHRFYSIASWNRYMEAAKSNEELNKVLSQFDKDNQEYVCKIMGRLNFLSELDISYTNGKLKTILNNMESGDASFVLAFMALNLDSTVNLGVEAKKELLSKLQLVINEFSQENETINRIEKY